MSCPETIAPETKDVLAGLATNLAQWRVSGALRAADDQLQAIRRSASAASRTEIARSAALMSDLLQIVCCAMEQDEAVDNDCSPASVMLTTDIATDLSIDFGFFSGPCVDDADCEDADICTDDVCDNGTCRHEIPPGGECVCTSVCPDVIHAGTITTTVDGNGDVTVLFNQATDINDNSYGTNIVNWPRSHNYSDLVGSDKAQFVVRDAKGNVVFDFFMDYISASSGTPSGYASLGVAGGEGSVSTGQASWLLEWNREL